MIVLLLIIWAIFAWACYKVGEPKGYKNEGIALGLFLGIFGLVIIALLPPKKAPQVEPPKAQAEWPTYSNQ
jgi:hypothetical protein